MSKVLSLLGLAKKAGRLAIGDEAVSDAIRHGRARLILIASDASENTTERFKRYETGEDKVSHYVIDSTKDELGAAVGRAKTAIAAVCEAGLAAEIARIVTEGMPPDSKDAIKAKRLEEAASRAYIRQKQYKKNGGAR